MPGLHQSGYAGNIGVQSGTIQFWGVQLEVGSTATPLEKPDPQQELAKCQRFYTVLRNVTFGGYAGQTTPAVWFSLPMPVTMRAAPTSVVPTSTGSTAGTTMLYSNGTSTAVNLYLNAATAATTIWCSADITVSADL